MDRTYESFCPKKYDAGATTSTFNEAKWRINQHLVHKFKLVLDSKESVSL
jgi:hypothetical protein